MNRTPLPDAVTDQRIIAIARRLAPDRINVLAEALLSAGITVLEITLDAEEAVSTIGRLQGSGLVVGAGTVMSAPAAEQAVSAGASFIVSPNTDDDVVRWALDAGIAIMPGALTPSEIAHAWDLGASAVKLFPASVGGPGLLRTLRGPFVHVPFIPTGGVDGDNAAAFLEAGAIAVGVGSWLTGSSNPHVIGERAAQLVAAASPR